MKPLGPAAMLGIGLARGVGCGEIGRVDLREEGAKVVVDPCGEPALRLERRVARAGLPGGLDRLHGRREGDIA